MTPMDKDSFEVGRLKLPPLEVRQRISRLIKGKLNPGENPDDNLYFVAYLAYQLGVIDTKRAERAKRKKAHQGTF